MHTLMTDAVWYADVPNKRCVRVREGGEVLQTAESDLGCFACMLGGPSGATLFICDSGMARSGERDRSDANRSGDNCARATCRMAVIVLEL
jgi:sugar lactone lactonase YvrE